MDYQSTLDSTARDVAPLAGVGRVASYIPELADVPGERFGLALIALDGQTYTAGDATERFSIRSISKVFTPTRAIQLVGEAIFERVGREPSGNPFNSLVQLEHERGIPRHPFINAALAWFLESFGNLRYKVETVLDACCRHCALARSCVEAARAFLFPTNEGVVPSSGERLLTRSRTKRLNALLLTCGVYDEAGEVAFRVGLPAKGGVGGGIAAVLRKGGIDPDAKETKRHKRDGRS